MTDLSTYNFCQVMTVATGQTVTCNRSFRALQAEQSSPTAEKAGLVSAARESNSPWSGLFFFTARLLFQMGARPDPCEYDQ